MKKLNILDILFWLFLLIALGYVIAKLTGLIGTPEWVEYIPIISIIFAAGIVYQRLVFFTQTTNRKTNYLKNYLDKLEKKQLETEKNYYALEEKQDLILDLLRKKK